MIIQYNRTMLPVDLTTGLIAYYPFLGNANDEVDIGVADGVVTGATLVTGVDDVANSAYSFNNDTTNRISIATQDLLNFTDGSDNDLPFSVSFWYKKTGDNTFYGLVTKHIYNTLGSGWLITYNTSTLGFTFSKFSAASTFIRGAVPFTIGDVYNHVVVNFKPDKVASTAFEIFINGEQKSYTNAVGGTYTGLKLTNTYPVTIGNYAGNNYSCKGDIDNVRIYNKLLTTKEIMKICNDKL